MTTKNATFEIWNKILLPVGGIRGSAELRRLVVGADAWAVSFCMFPVTVDQVMKVADAEKLMPPKVRASHICWRYIVPFVYIAMCVRAPQLRGRIGDKPVKTKNDQFIVLSIFVYAAIHNTYDSILLSIYI